MTDEAKLRVAALRWAHLHEDCNDADDTCPVQDECLRCTSVLCNIRVAANLIASLSEELEATEAIAALARGLEVERDQLKARLEHVEYERDAAVEDLNASRMCRTCAHYGDDGFISKRCINCASHCLWQWRGVPKEVSHD